MRLIEKSLESFLDYNNLNYTFKMEVTLKQTIIKQVLDEMMYLAGYDVKYLSYLKLNEEAKKRYTISQSAMDKWMNWGASHIEDRLRYNRIQAETEISWIHYNFGLLEK